MARTGKLSVVEAPAYYYPPPYVRYPPPPPPVYQQPAVYEPPSPAPVYEEPPANLAPTLPVHRPHRHRGRDRRHREALPDPSPWQLRRAEPDQRHRRRLPAAHGCAGGPCRVRQPASRQGGRAEPDRKWATRSTPNGTNSILSKSSSSASVSVARQTTYTTRSPLYANLKSMRTASFANFSGRTFGRDSSGESNLLVPHVSAKSAAGAVVGSSASSSRGLHDSAITIIARWLRPPDNGYPGVELLAAAL